MSSTGRNPRGGDGVDYFGTPAWAVHRLLDAIELPFGQWLEPGAGDGAIIRATKKTEAVFPPRVWSAIEITKPCQALFDTGAAVQCGDFLEMTPPDDQMDVCLTNPPFALAQEFVEHAMKWADVVVMLLRLNFLGSAARQPFLSMNPPDVYVLPQRPSFTGGKTDSIEYAWFVWGMTRNLDAPGRLEVLALTPAAERKAG